MAEQEMLTGDPFKDAYSDDANIQSLVQSLGEQFGEMDEAHVPQEAKESIQKPVEKLQGNIKKFGEQEKIYGPEPQVLKNYDSHQKAVVHTIGDVCKAYRDDASDDLKNFYVKSAVQSADAANNFWEREFAKLKEKDQQIVNAIL